MLESRHDPNVEFWCYLSKGFVQQHNRQVGFICSAKYLRVTEYPKLGEPDDPYPIFIRDPNLKGPVSLFQDNITKLYQIEYNIEVARKSHYPQLPSRFSALYVFGDLEKAKKADAKYKWSHHSDLVKLKPVHPEILCSYSQHDMEMISMARGEWRLFDDDLENLIRGYWEGMECKGVEYRGVFYKSEPIWEILYDGALMFAD